MIDNILLTILIYLYKVFPRFPNHEKAKLVGKRRLVSPLKSIIK